MAEILNDHGIFLESEKRSSRVFAKSGIPLAELANSIIIPRTSHVGGLLIVSEFCPGFYYLT